MYINLADFTTYSESVSPSKLVTDIDFLFTGFDRICQQVGIEKIKTIGDAYMCVGGLYTRGGNHVQRIVFAALEIQQFLADRKAKRTAKDGHLFEARGGIHMGAIVGGVI